MTMRQNVNGVNIESAAEDKSVPGRRYHHGNLREELIATALDMLEAQAEGTVSLRELARRVGVSPNAAYRHFPDKEALLAALAAEGFKRLAALQAGAGKGEGDPRAAFRAAGLAYVRFARQNPALFRLMFGRFHDTDSARRDEALAAASALAVEGLRRGVARAAGLAEDDTAAIRVHALRAWSLVHGLSLLVLDGQVAAEGEALERLIQAVLTPESLLAVP
ncbi:TetR/AcrR family transcriptional regulator [Pedomonas mirosovicensis]|uniref:TetR/AcrR family transcriptional regulator n=1 Tax=Pedomonas mirosovicensis TaxID=2908641 RepID=UPI002167DC80|nr:TetR/AcrR family transcriptional regulator [Pedomonas mirosovicensis]MCH8683840.1 TetR/AcrR family transcriptional regulator [Pedomonas mirosovicensis]